MGLSDQELLLDRMESGAWPFLVGGVICLVNSDNERDSPLLTITVYILWALDTGFIGTLCPNESPVLLHGRLVCGDSSTARVALCS